MRKEFKPADGAELLNAFVSAFAGTRASGPRDELIVRVARQLEIALRKIEGADWQTNDEGKSLHTNSYIGKMLRDALHMCKPRGPTKLEHRSIDTIMVHPWVLMAEKVLGASENGSTRKREIEKIAVVESMDFESVERKINRYARAAKRYIEYLDELDSVHSRSTDTN